MLQYWNETFLDGRYAKLIYMLSVVHFGEQYDPTGADGENRNERRTLVKK